MDKEKFYHNMRRLPHAAGHELGRSGALITTWLVSADSVYGSHRHTHTEYLVKPLYRELGTN